MNDENNKKNERDSLVEKENVKPELEGLNKRYFRFVRRKLVIIFIIGVLIGVALKGRILTKYVIGFEDYKAKNLQSDYNFELPEPEAAENQNQAPAQQAQPSCN